MFDPKALCRPSRAVDHLSRDLKNGKLALFIGAGAAIDVGFPGWKTLVSRCGLLAGMTCDQVKPFLRQKDYEGLASEVRRRSVDEEAFFEIVRAALYHRMEYESGRFLSSRLLRSVGALISGGVRGRIRDIVSLNFDDSLEWYLRLHGYPYQTVLRAPALLRDDCIRLFHVHGFLSHSQNSVSGDFLVLTRESVDRRLTGGEGPWRNLAFNIMSSKTCMFVGMSESTATDHVFSSLLYDVRRYIGDERPTGFWFFGEAIQDKDRDHLMDYNVIPLEFADHSETASFLLGVCEQAGRGLQFSS